MKQVVVVYNDEEFWFEVVDVGVEFDVLAREAETYFDVLERDCAPDPDLW